VTGATAGAPRYSNAARWWIVVLLALGCVVAYVDRVNLSFALIDTDFKQFFHISNTQRGLVNSAFFWSYAALQIPAGWLADRFGSKYPLAVSFALWSGLTALAAFTTGFASLFAVRLLLGMGEAIMHPASMRWIRYHFDESKRGLAIGLFMSGSKFGPAIGSVLAAMLIESYGWRAMFLILGLAAMVWLLPWLWFVRDDRATGTAATRAEPAQGDAPMSALLASPILLGVIIGTFAYMYFVYFCMTWMPAYLREARGLSLTNSGVYTTFSFAGMATMAIIGGFLADRMIAAGRDAVTVRKGFTIAGFVLASTEVLSPMLPLDWALAVSIFSLSGLGLATANYWALTQTLIPGSKTGRIVGIQNCAASIAGIVAPIITGWLVQRTGGYAAAMQMVLLFLACGILAYIFLVRPRPAAGPASG
jgi:MFS family permease